MNTYRTNILVVANGQMASEAVRLHPFMRFRVEDWMACGAGLGPGKNGEAESRYLRDGSGDAAQVANLPAILRRRISVVGQMAFRASYALCEQRTARFIFCSRHGEFDRSLRILHSLASGEPISPADFGLSVHNALAGLLSIAWGNTAGHTAISSGADSFGYGLFESVACLKTGSGDPVMLVYFDDLLPQPYGEIADGSETCVALAMLLKPPRYDRNDFGFDLEQRDRAMQPQSASAQALDFISFMLSGERERRTIGERLQWRWQRCD